MEVEKVKKQIELRKKIIKCMSSLILENKLQIYSDAHEDDQQIKVRPESNIYQQETSEPHDYDDDINCLHNMETPFYLNESQHSMLQNKYFNKNNQRLENESMIEMVKGQLIDKLNQEPHTFFSLEHIQQEFLKVFLSKLVKIYQIP